MGICIRGKTLTQINVNEFSSVSVDEDVLDVAITKTNHIPHCGHRRNIIVCAVKHLISVQERES